MAVWQAPGVESLAAEAALVGLVADMEVRVVVAHWAAVGLVVVVV